MSSVREAEARTRAFSRVIGPFLTIVSGIVALRVSQMGIILSAFFENEALVWIAGAMLLLAGIAIIALHQYWTNAAAILISVLGWLLVLRGLVLLIAPALFAYVAADALRSVMLVRVGSAISMAIGFYLTYEGWVSGPESPS